MTDVESLVLGTLFLVVALLYSSVGHAGASGYLAVMAIVGISPDVMKPTALRLNILVALIGMTKFYRVGAFSWRLFVPLASTSIPCAYLGGFMTLPGYAHRPMVGFILLDAAWHSFRTAGLRKPCFAGLHVLRWKRARASDRSPPKVRARLSPP